MTRKPTQLSKDCFFYSVIKKFMKSIIVYIVWFMVIGQDRASNVEIGVECQIFVIVAFLTVAEFYNLGHIRGIKRVH